jgi:protein-tyrosine sulfotransferase
MPTTQASSAEPPQAPVFILTTSRSGSTLVRFILDSHPEFACPPETSVSAALAQLARVWDILENTGPGERRPPMAAPAPSPQAAAALRAAIDDAFRDYLRARGKRRWCDKSLDTFQFADLLAQVYPDAKFIVLTRHCMDVIASGVEICPWGLSRFGFDQFVAQYPGNSVAAIGSYWLACTQANLAFAEKHPDSCHRVRYEDLVTAPEETAAAIFSFLGAAPAPGITETAFAAPHDSDGPGDEKIWFTSGVTGDSVGRGVDVPAGALPPPLRQLINETLAKLNYRTVEDDWNAASGPVDPRSDAHAAARKNAMAGDSEDGEVQAAMQAIAARIAARNQADLDAIAAYWPVIEGTTMRIIVQGTDGDHREIRWHFPAAANGSANGTDNAGSDAAQAERNGEANRQIPAIIAAPATWQSLLDGRSNFVTEITASRLRCVNPRDVHRLRSHEVHATAALLGLATIPVRTPTTQTEPKPSAPAPRS